MFQFYAKHLYLLMYAMRNKTYLCSIIIVVFMDLFSGGDPPLELPLVVGGGCFFLELKGGST